MTQQHLETKTNRPAHEIRIGAIRAAIWANQSENGLWHNVTFERTYRDGEEFKSAASFGRDDLLILSKVADMAHSWIASQGPRKPEPTPGK